MAKVIFRIKVKRITHTHSEGVAIFLCGSIKIPDTYVIFSDLCYASRHSTLDSLVKTNARR
jgi:hypothetical protein